MKKLAFVLLLAVSSGASGAEPPRLVILTESGQTRDGLPVLLPHPQRGPIAQRLDRGAARELVSVWQMVQQRRARRGGPPAEPAYVLLSNQQGGFARYGFLLGAVKKPSTPFVDVHRDWRLTGELGAIDQIFPHELAHAMLHELGVRPPRELRANQVHAVGVRTDRFTALNEGFAEHFQLVTVEHPDAAPETRAVAADEAKLAARLAAWRREMSARFAPATRMRMTFPLWYSSAERTLRYGAVKRNDFARQVAIAPHLLEGRARERAYLLENTLPGDRDGARKPLARLVATEGVVSSFFYAWANHPELQRRLRDDAFHAEYGVARGALTPLQNVYLKIFHVLDGAKPGNVLDFARAYAETFPDEAALVDELTLRVFGVSAATPLPPEIWLAGEFRTGTTVFDQFGAAPRVHTFDLNGASLLDLTTVDGVTPAVARAIAEAAPFASIDDVRRVAAVPPHVVATMASMAGRMATLGEVVDEEEISISEILMPYAWRAAGVLAITALAGAVLFHLIRRRWGLPASVARSILSGAGAAILAVLAAWILGSGVAAAAAVIVVFGVPAALVALRNGRRAALVTLLARAASVIPPMIATTAWF